jgi:hypothetical protein
MASFWKENQSIQTKKRSLKDSSWFGEPKCKLGSKVAHLFIYFIVFLVFLFNFVKMKDMLWIEDIVESTLALSFLTNFKVDMVGFVNLCKVVVRKITLEIFPSA